MVDESTKQLIRNASFSSPEVASKMRELSRLFEHMNSHHNDSSVCSILFFSLLMSVILTSYSRALAVRCMFLCSVPEAPHHHQDDDVIHSGRCRRYHCPEDRR